LKWRIDAISIYVTPLMTPSRRHYASLRRCRATAAVSPLPLICFSMLATLLYDDE